MRQALDGLVFGGQSVDAVVTEADETITSAIEEYNDENF